LLKGVQYANEHSVLYDLIFLVWAMLTNIDSMPQIIDVSKIHDTAANLPLPNPPPEGEGTEPSPNGGGQGGGKAVMYFGNINS